ncbi:nitronate monooxygenase [Streptomyces sp. NPDC004082]|uniref:nitronate monooxygenase n=1 Tax=Streptomyces sp. NPDC005481 TaxID=3154881 RepID=UPI00339DD15B
MSAPGRLGELLGIDHPIVQGPFGGGLSCVALAAAVSEGGGLGSYGAHIVTPDAITRLVNELKAATSRPFAVNLWVPLEGERSCRTGFVHDMAAHEDAVPAYPVQNALMRPIRLAAAAQKRPGYMSFRAGQAAALGTGPPCGTCRAISRGIGWGLLDRLTVVGMRVLTSIDRRPGATPPVRTRRMRHAPEGDRDAHAALPIDREREAEPPFCDAPEAVVRNRRRSGHVRHGSPRKHQQSDT